MPEFRCQVLAELTRQLTFAPPNRRRAQIDRAEQLYWQIDPEANYTVEYLIYRITRYKAEQAVESTTLVGAAVRDDLPTMVEQLSDSLDDPADRYDPRPLDLAQVARRLNVNPRTIARYRRQGLFARRLLYPNGRKKLAFLPASVEKFVQAHSRKVEEAAQYERIDRTTRHQIILRARRIAARVRVSPFRVAGHLARKYGRSVETIRRLLVLHDKHDPRFAIFRDHRPPLTARQRQDIYRDYQRGVSVARIAQHHGKTREAIHHVINLQRAAVLHALELRYVASPTFQLPDAEQVILGAALPDHREKDGADESDDLPPALRDLLGQPMPDAPTESAEGGWFARYNYLKFRARQIVDQLDEHHPRSGRLDAAETFLRHADQLRRRMMRTYLRIVVSVARGHQSAQPRDAAPSLLALIRQGEGVLAEAMEEFDFTKGGRFPAYLRWALMRRFAQSQAPPPHEPPEAWQRRADADRGLSDLLAALDERQRIVVTRHFGLVDPGAPGDAPPAPQTLAAVGKILGITPARARQIERQALKKLRQAAAQSGVDLDAALNP